MSFLGNDAINRVNLHSAIQALAQGGGQIFFLVVLLSAGISVPAALLAQGVIMVGRLAIRPFVLPIAKRTGVKPLLIFGTLAVAAEYPLLARVDGVGPELFTLCAVAAVADVFYWLAFNAYFAAVGDAQHRGRQIGMRETMIAISGIVAPLLGAWALVTFGAHWAFAAVALVQVLSALPLLGAPNVQVPASAPGSWRAARLGFTLSAADAVFDVAFFFVWQIALFLTLKESIAAYGGAMALAGLAGAACAFWLGTHVDAGRGRRAVLIGYGAATLVLLARALSLDAPIVAVIANAAGAFAMPLLGTALVSCTANLAQRSPCPLRFHMAAEAGWDIGGIVGCAAAAAIAASGAPLSFALLLGLPPAVVTVALLLRYYARTTALAVATPP